MKSIVLPLRARLCEIFDEIHFSVGGRELYFLYFKAEVGFYLKLRKTDKCSRCYKKLVGLK